MLSVPLILNYKDGSHAKIIEAKCHSYYREAEINGATVNQFHGIEILKGLTPIWRQEFCQLYSEDGNFRDRQFILALGLHTEQEMAKDGFGAYWDGSYRLILDKEDLRDYWIEISFDRDFLGPAPSYVLIRDPVRRLCHRMIAYSISGEEERGQVSGGHFIGRLAMHFGLVIDERLRGLQVVTRELPLIDLHELGRLNICRESEDACPGKLRRDLLVDP
ncbi:hypothetical protein Tco_1304414 [Tanacetum coccineum]